MRTLILYCIMIFCTLHISYSSEREDKFNALRASVDLQQNEKIIIFFSDMGNCIKCYISPYNVYSTAMAVYKEKGLDTSRVKLVAAVAVNRRKESRAFKKKYKWGHTVFPDVNSKLKRLLKLQSGCFLAVFSYSGALLYAYKTSDYVAPNDRKNPEVINMLKALESEY